MRTVAVRTVAVRTVTVRTVAVRIVVVVEPLFVAEKSTPTFQLFGSADNREARLVPVGTILAVTPKRASAEFGAWPAVVAVAVKAVIAPLVALACDRGYNEESNSTSGNKSRSNYTSKKTVCARAIMRFKKIGAVRSIS